MLRQVNYRARQQGQTLILIAIALVGGGAGAVALGDIALGHSIKHLHKSARAVAAGDEQSQQLDLIFSDWKVLQKKTKKGIKADKKSLQELARAHASTQDQFDSWVDDVLAADAKVAQELIEIQYQLRDATTPVQWDAMISQAK